jgi:hypothetical protein
MALEQRHIDVLQEHLPYELKIARRGFSVLDKFPNFCQDIGRMVRADECHRNPAVGRQAARRLHCDCVTDVTYD